MKTHHYCRSISLLILTSILPFYISGQVKIGNNAEVLDPSAVLELEKTDRGLLIPRISLSGPGDISTITHPANSLLIYNIATAGVGDDLVLPGFYYWSSESGRWMSLVAASRPITDVWIDPNQNILSRHSANQSLTGADNIILGYEAFSDLHNPSTNVIAIGSGACHSDTTIGDAYVIAIGKNTARNNGGPHLNAIGLEAAMNNSGEFVNAAGTYAAYNNSGSNINAFGNDAAYANTQSAVNAFGNAAARNNTGFEINALGPNSCFANTGQVVNAIGLESAYSNAGNDVNAFGVRAAQHNGEDGDNVNAMGIEAGQNNTGGAVNFLGEGAGRNNQGSLVNALGGAAGENNTGWSSNLLGNQAGQFNTGAELNAMGAMAAQHNTHAGVNAFGLSSAQYNHNAEVNALGFQAAQYNTGFGVNALGVVAGRFNDGDHAIAIGQSALYGDSLVMEGAGNIGIGFSAASNVGGGSLNICIGYDADIPDSTASHQINLGNNIIREADGMIRMKDFLKLTPLDTPPATSEEGTIYYDANDHMLYVRTDSGWQALW